MEPADQKQALLPQLALCTSRHTRCCADNDLVGKQFMGEDYTNEVSFRMDTAMRATWRCQLPAALGSASRRWFERACRRGSLLFVTMTSSAGIFPASPLTPDQTSCSRCAAHLVLAHVSQHVSAPPDALLQAWERAATCLLAGA